MAQDREENGQALEVQRQLPERKLTGQDVELALIEKGFGKGVLALQFTKLILYCLVGGSGVGLVKVVCDHFTRR